ATLLLGTFILCRPASAAKPPILRGPNSMERIAAIHSVAIMPIECPGALDCASSENELIAYLRGKLHLKVVGSARLSQALFERSIAVADLLSKETGPPLLKELGVSALLVQRVLDYRRVD